MAFLLKANFKPLSFPCILAEFFRINIPIFFLRNPELQMTQILPAQPRDVHGGAAVSLLRFLYPDIVNEAHAQVCKFLKEWG